MTLVFKLVPTEALPLEKLQQILDPCPEILFDALLEELPAVELATGETQEATKDW